MLVSFERRNIRHKRTWLFAKGHGLRFEWMALLAYRRRSDSTSRGWVSVQEIARLPRWRGKSDLHIGTNVGRYLQTLRQTMPDLIEAQSTWSGPYRLSVNPLSIEFDIPIENVRIVLRQEEIAPIPSRQSFQRYAFIHSRAQHLMFRGRLRGNRFSKAENALDELIDLSNNPTYKPTLRVLACLAAVQVHFRSGQFASALKRLQKNLRLAGVSGSDSLKARYYVNLAWSRQRATTTKASNRTVDALLAKANIFADRATDVSAAGYLAHRTAGFLTKQGRHLESAHHLIQALEAFLITSNFDMVQATCGNLGSVLHRLGTSAYEEARDWLLTGIAIARWMDLGREDAHGEMILAKMYAETGKRHLSQLWLQKAERIAKSAGNQVGVADIKMVWAFWHRSFGTRAAERDTLIEALHLFRSIPEFDYRQKRKYIRQTFPEVWPAIRNMLTH